MKMWLIVLSQLSKLNRLPKHKKELPTFECFQSAWDSKLATKIGHI